MIETIFPPNLGISFTKKLNMAGTKVDPRDPLKTAYSTNKEDVKSTIANLIGMFYLLSKATGVTFPIKNAKRAFYLSCFVILGK